MNFAFPFLVRALALGLTGAALVAQDTHLSSISTRGQVSTGGSIMISGFNVPAGADRTVLIRAAGPTLANFSLTGLLANPKLELYNSAGTKIYENDDWGSTTALSAAFGTAGAFAFNANSLESALLVTLPAGGYTAQVGGVNSTTGVALVEVYDLSSGTNYLTSLSTRGPVGTGSALLIAGFDLAPASTTRRLLVRAVGPTLSSFSLSGALADSKLELYNSTGTKIAENDDWATASASAGSALAADATALASAFTKAGAFAYASTASKDSALLIDLPGGSYTAQVSGVNSTTGLALVEVYDVTNAGIVITTTAPAITTQPASLSVATGAAATFTVVASGTAPLTYQWYRAGVAVSGATAATYTIGSVAATHAGSYTVVVTNSAGSATGSAATLTVTTTTTAANTAAVVAAADAFKATLSAAELATTQLAHTLAHARTWTNLPAATRNGFRLGSMTAPQLAAATALINAALGSAGRTVLEEIRLGDEVIHLTRTGENWGYALYNLCLVGTPSTTSAWMLQISGHHLAFNITYNGPSVSGSPMFLGTEPTNWTDSSNVAHAPVEIQRAAVSALATALQADPTLATTAKLGGTFSDVLMGASGSTDGNYPFTYPATGRGALYSTLSAAQQALVKTAIRAWVNNLADDVAATLLAAYENDAALAATYVGFAVGSGGTADFSANPSGLTSQRSYFRIDGPRVWIEFVSQQGVAYNTRVHYHTIYRDKTADYGASF